MRGSRRRVLLAGAQLQDLAEQDQHGDAPPRPRNRPRRSPMAAESGGKSRGRKRREDAVNPGGAGAERNEAKHVEIACTNECKATHEKRPAGPQHHRARKCQLDKIVDMRRKTSADIGKMAAHFQRDHRQRQHQADPEPPRHIDEFADSGGTSAVTVTGSSAMPQIGQAPGPTCRICGCIGQV